MKNQDPNGIETVITYDGERSLAVTLYIYDDMGNLIKQIDPINYDPAMDSSMLAMSMLGISYVYDKMNRRTQTKDTSGRVLECIQYDANGNVKKIVDGLRLNGNMETSKGTSYIYDGLNRVVQVTDALGNSRHYEHDILGNLTGQTDGRRNTTRWEYKPVLLLQHQPASEAGGGNERQQRKGASGKDDGLPV